MFDRKDTDSQDAIFLYGNNTHHAPFDKIITSSHASQADE